MSSSSSSNAEVDSPNSLVEQAATMVIEDIVGGSANPNKFDDIIFVTILEMLRDRKYKFDNRQNVPDLLTKLDQIKPEKYKNSDEYFANLQEHCNVISNLPFMSNSVNDISSLPLDAKGNPVYVYIQSDNKILTERKDDHIMLTKKIATNLKGLTTLFEDQIKDLKDVYDKIHLIIIFNGSKNEQMKFEVNSHEIYNLEYFPKKSLYFNITKHIWVPRHTLLSPELAKEYMKEFQATSKTTQMICLDDPINRYYYGQSGDLYSIDRRPQGHSVRIVTKRLIANERKK